MIEVHNIKEYLDYISRMVNSKTILYSYLIHELPRSFAVISHGKYFILKRYWIIQ
jgi:hypothetical protein